jgi:APA family basic amino acid/polyamine antiporter
MPTNNGTFGAFGWSGVFRGAAIVFFAYVGFDMVASAAQEAKRPERDIPAGILISLAICAILYLGMATIMTGMVPFNRLGVSDPVYVALDAAGPSLNWLRWVVTLGIVVGLASATLISLYGQSRIFYVMARDGLLPPIFAKVNLRTRTPTAGTVIVGLVAGAIAAVLPLDILGELSSIGTLLAFAIVCAGVLILRKSAPEIDRPFRVPYATAVCVSGIVGCVWLMLSLPIDTWVRLVVWLIIGIAVYALYSAPRSKVGRGLAVGEQECPKS